MFLRSYHRRELRDGIFILKLELVIEIISQKTVKIEKEINNINFFLWNTRRKCFFSLQGKSKSICESYGFGRFKDIDQVLVFEWQGTSWWKYRFWSSLWKTGCNVWSTFPLHSKHVSLFSHFHRMWSVGDAKPEKGT